MKRKLKSYNVWGKVKKGNEYYNKENIDSWVYAKSGKEAIKNFKEKILLMYGIETEREMINGFPI